MTANASNPVVLMLGTARGAFLFHSDLDRRTWRMTGPHLDGWEVYSLFGDPRTGRLLAGTSSYVYGPTIRVSDDMGATWRQIERGPTYAPGRGFELARIWQIVAGHPSEPGSLYAGVEPAGLFVSRDGGDTWSEVEGLTNHPSRPHWMPGGGGLCLHTIVPDPTNPRRIWVAISAAGAFRTDDAGVTWDRCNAGLRVVATGTDPAADVAHCVHKIALDPAGSGALFMQYHGGVYRSDDGASSWKPIEQGLPGNFGFPMVATRDGTLFVVPLDSDERRHVPAGMLLAFRSRDAGATWHPTGAGLPEEPQYVGVLRDAMAADPLDPAGVYFGTTMGEVFYSRDGGDEWHRLPGTFPRITSVKVMTREE